jgi:predicted dehydrogenase
MSSPVDLVLLGAGGRGLSAYGQYALMNPHRARFVAVAEPVDERREAFARAHGIPATRCYRTWEDLLAEGQLAPGLVNATMDRMHVPSTLAALATGYDVLLEKPMATTPIESVQLVQAAERHGRLLQICHVMRYTLFWRKVHEIVRSGRLGRIIDVEHRENVAYWHMAHSFVRGNWRNSAESSPMILAKCCHDMDILHWILGSPVHRLSSFGRLSHFRADQAPTGAPARCTDGCPARDRCPYFAPRIYLGSSTDWPTSAIALDLSIEGRLKALRKGPYGRCVYHCDNDVVDHQVINMELVDDTTILFSMQGHSHNNARTMRYSGTLGTLRASEDADEITVYDYVTGNEETVRPGRVAGGHGGGDLGVMDDYVAALQHPGQAPLTNARASLESHLMAFASEEARIKGVVLDMAAFRERVEVEAARERR